MNKRNSLAGKSWVLGAVDALGNFGVMQVFDIAQYGNSADEDYWSGAETRARDAAIKALNGWQYHFVRTRPGDTLVIRMVDGGRCDPIINKIGNAA